MCVRVAVNYVDMRFSNFAIEYLRENEIFRETVFAQVESCKQKRMVENLVTLPLSLLLKARFIRKNNKYTWIVQDLDIYKQSAQALIRHANPQRNFPPNIVTHSKLQCEQGVGVPRSEWVAWRRQELLDLYTVVSWRLVAHSKFRLRLR